MPNRIAHRDETLMYNDKIQDEILSFLAGTIKHDYVNGTNEINLDLTVSEAGKLFNADDNIRAMAENGKLQELHQRCND